MKKRILSVLLSVSMVIGIISANAVSISFDELSEEASNSSIYFEEMETESEEVSNETEIQTIENKNINSEEIISSAEATENQFIDINNGLYPITYNSEIEDNKPSIVSQNIKQPASIRGSINVNMSPITIDLTDLATGEIASHNCNLYLGTNYDETYHWDECTICKKIFNKVNHSCTYYWTMGNSCSRQNKYIGTCSCGFQYVASDNTRTHYSPYLWAPQYNHSYHCNSCNESISTPESHYNSSGTLGCFNPGKCSYCGTYVYGHMAIGNYNFATKEYTAPTCYHCKQNYGSGTASFSGNANGFTAVVTITAPFQIQSLYCNYDSYISATHSKSFNGHTATFYISGSYTSKIEKTQGLYCYAYGPSNSTIFFSVIISPDNAAPVIKNIEKRDLSYLNDWVTQTELTISGTEDYCGTINISITDDDGNIYLNNTSVSVNNNNWSYTFMPALEVEEKGKKFTITAKDKYNNISQSEIYYYKVDSKAPTMITTPATSTEWSKTKDLLIETTDFGTGNVSIAFNNENNYITAEQQEDFFLVPYTLTGDVYGSTVVAIYAKDGLDNTETQFVTVYNLDNTVPTITDATSERQGTRNAIVTVTANDINTKLNASGSGITGYAITQEKNVPNESEFQSENTFNVTKSGTWYVWAIDAVGNISNPVAVDVKIEYTVSLNPNDGILTGDSTYQIISGETITIPEPTRTGYTFTGWTVIGEGSTVNGNKFTMGSEDTEITAQWKINKYPVIYIDKNLSGTELGRTIKQVDYNSSVHGADLGSSTADNAYYNQYRYVSDTSATVATEGAIVYRVFEFCETEKESHLTWNDRDNADGLRPEKYTLKLKQNGKIIDEIELPSNQTDYIFENLPKYDTEGNPYHYELETIVSDRYKTDIDEDGNLIIEDYQPASFSVTIPKKITLNGNTGKANYTVSVNGTFYYNDTLIVIPKSSFTLTDRNKISSMQANVSQQKTGFTKEDLPSSINGDIQTNRRLFSGKWQGNFNFDIKFVMKN